MNTNQTALLLTEKLAEIYQLSNERKKDIFTKVTQLSQKDLTLLAESISDFFDVYNHSLRKVEKQLTKTSLGIQEIKEKKHDFIEQNNMINSL